MLPGTNRKSIATTMNCTAMVATAQIGADRRAWTPGNQRVRADTAVRMPCRIAIGGGGQPGTATSTGITFDTRPQLA